jgi:hypothetical protein
VLDYRFFFDNILCSCDISRNNQPPNKRCRLNLLPKDVFRLLVDFLDIEIGEQQRFLRQLLEICDEEDFLEYLIDT